MRQFNAMFFFAVLFSVIMLILFNQNPLILGIGLGGYFLSLALGYLAWWRSPNDWRMIWQHAGISFNLILFFEFLYSAAIFLLPFFIPFPNLALLWGIAAFFGVGLGLFLLSRLFLPQYFIFSLQHEKAIRVLNFNLRLEPKNDNFLLWRGIARHTNYDFDAALRDYGVIIRSWLNKKKNKVFVLPALRNRASILIQRRLLDAAMKDAHLAHEIDPNYASAYQIQAEIFSAWENYVDALEMIDEAIEMQKDFNFFITKAQILMDMEQYQKALVVLDEAQKIVPNEEGLITFRSVILLNMGDLEAASAFCDEWLPKLKDENLRLMLMLNRAAINLAAENYEQAMMDYEKLLVAKMPSLPYKEVMARVHYGLGIMHFKTGDYLEAVKAFQESLLIWPEFTVVMLGILAAQKKLGQEELAKETWAKFQSIPSKYQYLKRYEKDNTFPKEILEIAQEFANQGQLPISSLLQSNHNEAISKHTKDLP